MSDASAPEGETSSPIDNLCPGASPDAGENDSATTSGAGALDGSFAACGCTRRPGAGSSFECPMGGGDTANGVIGPSGGMLELKGRQFIRSGLAASLTVPPSALAAPTMVALTETTVPPPAALLDWSPVYRLDPLGLPLAQAVDVVLPWSNSAGTFSPADPPPLSMWFSADGTCFTRLADSNTNGAGFEQATITAFGFIVVGAPRSPSTATCP